MTRTSKTVLVATDFSDASDEALTHAIGLAKQMGAALDILHVIELGAEVFPYGLSYFDDRGGLIAHVDRELTKRADLAAAAGVTARTRMREGSAAQEILEHGREVGADLVVVGSHGRTGLAHALIGSVAERVVRHARFPVLTIPFSKKEQKKAA
jgi:nucleotide-binding universal stress UspA family protein